MLIPSSFFLFCSPAFLPPSAPGFCHLYFNFYIVKVHCIIFYSIAMLMRQILTRDQFSRYPPNSSKMHLLDDDKVNTFHYKSWVECYHYILVSFSTSKIFVPFKEYEYQFFFLILHPLLQTMPNYILPFMHNVNFL